MTTLAEKIRFAETYVSDKNGRRFSLKGRDWVRDQFWLPADGYKLWRADDADPCNDCVDQIGTIIETPLDNPTISKRHAKTGCPGLEAQPIIVTIQNLPRQEGKTFSSTAYALAAIFKGINKSVAFLAASEDQASTLFDENYKAAIQAKNPDARRLAKRCSIVGTTITVPKTNGIFEALSTSHKSVTGRARSHVLVDEARDVPARTAWALIPAISNMEGIECPRGHVWLTKEDAVGAPAKCTACGLPLVPWYGRIIITSSSGVIEEDGSEADWLAELIDLCLQSPRPNVHVHQMGESTSPSRSKTIVDVLANTFGELESMGHYVDADLSNRWRRKGRDVVTKADLDRVEDPTLKNTMGITGPCVAFLDCSLTIEKTALVIMADDLDLSSEPWEYVYQDRLEFWIPANEPDGIISDRVIYKYLKTYMHLYPGLKLFGIDTRGLKWPRAMMQRARRDRMPWASKMAAWDKHGSESDLGWNSLQMRILQRTIRLQACKEQRAEFRGVMLKPRKDAPPKVEDRNRRKSHKDITEADALCCFMIDQESEKKRRAGMADTERSGGPGGAAGTLERIRARNRTRSKVPKRGETY